MVGGPVKGATPRTRPAASPAASSCAGRLDSGGSGAVVVTATDSSDPAVVGQS